jgi:thiamine biosynthesis protein ThiS
MTSTDKQIEFNGLPEPFSKICSVSELLHHKAVTGRFLVVLNDEVVPKAEWSSKVIIHGDRVDIITAISGG